MWIILFEGFIDVYIRVTSIDELIESLLGHMND